MSRGYLVALVVAVGAACGCTRRGDDLAAACDGITAHGRSGERHLVGASEILLDVLVGGVERSVTRQTAAGVERVVVRGDSPDARCRDALGHLRAALPREQYDALVRCLAEPGATPGRHAGCLANAGL